MAVLRRSCSLVQNEEQIFCEFVYLLAAHAERRVRAADNVEPEAPDLLLHALVLPGLHHAGSVAGHCPIGGVVGGVSELEGDAAVPPLPVLLDVDDAGHLLDPSLVVPVQHILLHVVAVAVVMPQALVPQPLHVKRNVGVPALERILNQVAVAKLEVGKVKDVAKGVVAVGDELDEPPRRLLDVPGGPVLHHCVAENFQE
mmetsp:Transcript_26818/g.50823  ORF Transcript_26818/g.50823 Transcript_26818/m.50823 type:complete len:200 (-) Transcript_26818:534-1133(-)